MTRQNQILNMKNYINTWGKMSNRKPGQILNKNIYSNYEYCGNIKTE